MRVLVTGGAGFIGSHTCKRLAQNGFDPIVFDNLSRGSRQNVKWGPLVIGDIRDGDALLEAFKRYRPVACIHFAALAYVGESYEAPETYYSTNVVGTLSLLAAMRAAQIEMLVFSSSCATYGSPSIVPITENTEQRPINPYGASKLVCERMIQDFANAYGISAICLRYFNACGADPDHELSEDHDPETHLIPRSLMAAAKLIDRIEIYGGDYSTPDGTCIRDYIHVSDLAEGHLLALKQVISGQKSLNLNLGTGRGYSIKEILKEIEAVVGIQVPYEMRPRRIGDPAVLIADGLSAKNTIGFEAKYSELSFMIRTAAFKYQRSFAKLST